MSVDVVLPDGGKFDEYEINGFMLYKLNGAGYDPVMRLKRRHEEMELADVVAEYESAIGTFKGPIYWPNA